MDTHRKLVLELKMMGAKWPPLGNDEPLRPTGSL